MRRCAGRPAIYRDDRFILLLLARLTCHWRRALHLVSPDTLLRWHRDLYKLFWRKKSRPKSPPKRLSPEVIELIRRMAKDNALWGAERIRGELLKLGVQVSKRTIQKYMREVRPPGRQGQSWKTFVRNHGCDTWACDFLQLNDVLFRPIFALFFVVHGSREVVHVNVTGSPTDAWTAQQLREATPCGEAPRFLVRDNDGKFGTRFATVAAGTDIDVVRIPPRSPNLNPICERFLGSVRRECLDHIVIVSERQLRRVLREYVQGYFNTSRPHQGLGQRIPFEAANDSVVIVGKNVISFPVLGGLHHDYRLAASSGGSTR